MGTESRMMIVLSDQERNALREISQQELRGMREQARYLLRSELRRRGLLSDRQPRLAGKNKAASDD